MAVRTGAKPTFLRGRSMRVTRTDNCGRVVYGVYNQAVSEGIVNTTFTPRTVDSDEINVPNFAGDRCVYEASVTTLAGYDVEIEFCAVDFEMFEIITKQTLVLNAFGSVVGIETDTKITLDDEGFGLETWIGATGTDVCLNPNARGEWGYLLMPRLQGGIVGDITIANDAINFTITGAGTREGNFWGNGPYPVELSSAGTSEVQRATITGVPTGGTFTLTYDGQTTAAIAYNAASTAVQTALEALSNVGVGDIVVSGGPGPASPYTFTFQGGLAGTDVPAMTATGSFTGGTTPAIAITIITPGVAPVPGPLFQAVSRTAALRIMITSVAPPTEVVGARPVLNPALPALTTIVPAGTGLTRTFTVTPVSTGPVWYDFGDGEWDYVVAPGAASHTYDVAGTYTILASQNGINWATLSLAVS